ncbi:MAG: glutathione S-transferase family protein [Alphaproteobacteria bacterium]|nr:glutathione S-transferase family protein [Alphaproteobacteria bacterium]
MSAEPARYLIYGGPVSPFVRKVRLVLAMKGLAYDFEPVDVFNPPDWFVEISPLRRIPVLRDRARGGETLADSSAICFYLDRAHPAPPLLPDDPWLAGRAAWLEEYADTEFAYRVGMGVFRARFLNPRIGKPVDEALAQKTLTESVPKYFNFFERELADNPYFLGADPSLADIAIATHFVNFGYGGERVDASRWPRLAAFVERMFSMPAFAALMEEEAEALGL